MVILFVPLSKRGIIFVTDGFAFSQEEHGAVLQVNFAHFSMLFN